VSRRAVEAGVAAPEADPGLQPSRADVLESASHRHVANLRLGTVLRTAAQPFLGAECQRIQRGHRIGPIAEPPPQRAVNTRSGIEPRGRHDHRVDERALDAVEHRRFVALVDDADRHEQHPGAEVQSGVNEEVQIRLLQLKLAALFQPFDDGMFELELTDEA
jgi:hypothetical protein